MPTSQDIEIHDSATRTADAADELRDVTGEKMVLNMGPSHPATHGVLRLKIELDGETILNAQPDVGYLHRGDEKIAENMTYTQFIPYTDRLDYLAPLANNVHYALAVEKLLGVDDKLPERCQYIRVICCELARVSAHLLGLGAFAMDTGAFTVFLHTFTEREKIYYLIEALTGARFTTTYTRIGGLSRDLPEGWTSELKKFLDEVEQNFNETEKLLTRNPIFLDRTRGVGVVSREEAIDFGLSGPNLRGSGVDHDLRKAHPYLVYDQLDFKVPLGEGRRGVMGDCWDRTEVRMAEMLESLSMVRQCLEKMPDGEIQHLEAGLVLRPAPGRAYAGVENPRGELGHWLVSDGTKNPIRVRMRSPSFCNLSVVEHLLPGTMLGDAAAILGSVDIVVGETDR